MVKMERIYQRKKKKKKKREDKKQKKTKKKKKSSIKEDEQQKEPEKPPPFVLKQQDVANAVKKTYRVGTIVRMHSLADQTQYNNKFGRIIGYNKSQKGGRIDIYYVKILGGFKKTQFRKENVLKVQDMRYIEGIKERSCWICSWFIFYGILALCFIGAAVYGYFFYRNDGWWYWGEIGVGGIGVLLLLWAILLYLKSRFCCCFCNCCYVRGKSICC